MKRLVICVYAITISLNSFATGQAGDIIFSDGIKWTLLGKPMESDSMLFHNFMGILPENRSISTANWEGYTCYWSIKNERLYLDSAKVFFYNHETKKDVEHLIPSSDMYHVFNKYYDENGIAATWMTGNIRIAQGKMLIYKHDAYERYYEHEQIITFKQGRVTGRETFHNRMVVDGLSLASLNQEDIKAKFPLQTDSCPELDGVKKIIFRIYHFQIDSLGNLVDCQLKAIPIPWQQGDKRPPILEELEKKMENILKSIHPWMTYYFNGEYLFGDSEGLYKHGFIIPYPLD